MSHLNPDRIFDPEPAARKIARELAPLAGHYPALWLGPPWWFNDSVQGMTIFRERITETAGFSPAAGGKSYPRYKQAPGTIRYRGLCYGGLVTIACADFAADSVPSPAAGIRPFESTCRFRSLVPCSHR